MLALTKADSVDDETDVVGSANGYLIQANLRVNMRLIDHKNIGTSGRIRVAEGTESLEHVEAIEKLAIERRKTSVRYLEHRISMRSRIIVKKVQEPYTDLTPDPKTLLVFCVGRPAY
jgi:hypothetical protein